MSKKKFKHKHSNTTFNKIKVQNNMENANVETEKLADENTQQPQNDCQNQNNSINPDTVSEEQTQQTEIQEDTPKQEEIDFKQKFEEINDKYLRLAAEFDNYRKRTLKEKMDLTKYASEDVLKDILPVVDNMERAIKSMETATDMNAVREGITLIYNKFKEFMNKRGLKEIDAYGLELNTDLHEAITKFAAPNEELKGKIIDVIEKGYFLNDKVIRYAKVVVGE